MMKDRVLSRTLGMVALAVAASTALAHAQTPSEAYARGCGGCHTSERRVLRAIPSGNDAVRLGWIEKFMAQHPCERDDLKPLIVEYLLQRTRR